jgi:hypothetical protein
VSRPRRLAPLVAAVLLTWAGHAAAAESSLVLPLPDRFEEIAATTYDPETGKAVGGGFIRFERDDATVRMEGATGIEGGANTHVVAELAMLPDGAGLRLLRQESRSVDVTGQAMGVLEIDHEAGEGRCTARPATGSPPRRRPSPCPPKTGW